MNILVTDYAFGWGEQAQWVGDRSRDIWEKIMKCQRMRIYVCLCVREKRIEETTGNTK